MSKALNLKVSLKAERMVQQEEDAIKLLDEITDGEFLSYCVNCKWGTVAQSYEDATAFIGVHFIERPDCAEVVHELEAKGELHP